MSRRNYIKIAFALAFILTVAGFSQTLACKTWPPNRTVFWFPLILIADAFTPIFGTLTMVFLALIQFPLLALYFSIGIRWLQVTLMAILVVMTYVLMVLVAWTLVSNHFVH
jgi:hypothetical protein